MRWCEVDVKAEILKVRHQLTRGNPEHAGVHGAFGGVALNR